MTSVLFLFLDGIGLGEPDPEVNPFVRANLPTLNHLIGDQPLTLEAAPHQGETSCLIALDANLGVAGAPQSASGQAVLLTGRNVPEELGGHYGPKPNPQISEILHANNLFMEVVAQDGKAGLLNAYPPGYFQGIESGKRLYSAIPLALSAAGIPLKTAEDLQRGVAMSVDFTNKIWSAQPGFPPAPIYSHDEAGQRLATLAQAYDLAWFDFWPSDYAGHRRDMDQAVALLESFDRVFGSLLMAWNRQSDLIVLTSDHGNLEDLSQRAHTRNPVPCLLIGPAFLIEEYAEKLRDLTDIAPMIRTFLKLNHPQD